MRSTFALYVLSLKRVRLGELSRPSSKYEGRLVNGVSSRRASGLGRSKPRRGGSLRRGRRAASALCFEIANSGSERNRGGCSRRPKPTLSNSLALWLTDPLVNTSWFSASVWSNHALTIDPHEAAVVGVWRRRAPGTMNRTPATITPLDALVTRYRHDFPAHATSSADDQQ